jgi:hypothetical protein
MSCNPANPGFDKLLKTDDKEEFNTVVIPSNHRHSSDKLSCEKGQ